MCCRMHFKVIKCFRRHHLMEAQCLWSRKEKKKNKTRKETGHQKHRKEKGKKTRKEMGHQKHRKEKGKKKQEKKWAIKNTEKKKEKIKR